MKVGDKVWVDGKPYVIEGVARYVGAYPNRKEGVTVRPVDGGRAKVVALRRVSKESN